MFCSQSVEVYVYVLLQRGRLTTNIETVLEQVSLCRSYIGIHRNLQAYLCVMFGQCLT